MFATRAKTKDKTSKRRRAADDDGDDEQQLVAPIAADKPKLNTFSVAHPVFVWRTRRCSFWPSTRS